LWKPKPAPSANTSLRQPGFLTVDSGFESHAMQYAWRATCCSAGVSPAIFPISAHRKNVGETPALRKTRILCWFTTICPADPGCVVRIRLRRPTETKQSAIDFSRFRARPVAQRALAKETLNSRVGDDLARSIRSARTRRARALTERTASCLVLPYTITPGRVGISAIQRPSASRSISI
jgi:hypothetical protein